MAPEHTITVASAVILPESHDLEISTSTGAAKRRQSSVSETDSKRPRLDSEAATSDDIAPTNPSLSSTSVVPPTAPAADTRRRSTLTIGGAEEDRKRGKRLFGALLGTLSQSTSSRTQKRREDIEKKSQIKLKQQDEEREVEKRKNAEDLRIERLKEQKIWDKNTACIQRENTQALARFLKTKAKPELYYSPWKFLQAQQEQLHSQTEQVANHQDNLEPEYVENEQSIEAGQDANNMSKSTDAQSTANTVGSNDGIETDATANLADTENNTDTNSNNTTAALETELHKDAVEDNEDLMVDTGEDPVLY